MQRLRDWLVREFHSVDRALPLFDLDADGELSAQELSRAASQAGVLEQEIPALLVSLGVRPGGHGRIDVLADRLAGRAAPAAAQGASSWGAATWHPGQLAQAPLPLPPPLPPGGNLGFTIAAPSGGNETGGNGFLQVAKEALKMNNTRNTELLRLLQVGKDAAGLSPERREQDAVAWLASAPAASALEVKDAMGSSLLVLASRLGFQEVCKALLNNYAVSWEEQKCYANKSNDMGWTPLLLAAQNGYTKICEQLLKAEADPNLTTSGTRLTALMLAASNGHVSVVRLLLDPGWSRSLSSRADPWRISVDGRTAFDFVKARLQARGRLAEDQQQLEKGVPDRYGVRRPEIVAQPNSYNDIERLLLDLTKGVRVPVRGKEVTGSKTLGELHQDLLLGYVAPSAVVYQPAAAVRPEAAKKNVG